ncbi:MAG TPA: hypothetical protein VJV79_04040 [Polyangiaceae bacterium]|nr:hypothetical protein [Polyangiaceae bacterium]
MSTQPTVTDESARTEAAWRAIYDFTQRCLVFIVDGPINEDKFASPNGSGTLFLTPGGNTVVLTAAHVLNDPPGGYSLGGMANNVRAVHNPFTKSWKHPSGQDGVDVAVALLTDEAAQVFAKGAISVDAVAAPNVELEPTDPTVICGYLEKLRTQKLDHANKIKYQGFVALSYNTRVVGFDEKRGRYKMAWDEGIADHDPEGMFKVFGFEKGTTFKQPIPSGVSGGPLWRLTGVKLDRVWSASSAATIIGVCESWDTEAIEFCPSVRVWADWFRETIVAVDSR